MRKADLYQSRETRFTSKSRDIGLEDLPEIPRDIALCHFAEFPDLSLEPDALVQACVALAGRRARASGFRVLASGLIRVSAERVRRELAEAGAVGAGKLAEVPEALIERFGRDRGRCSSR